MVLKLKGRGGLGRKTARERVVRPSVLREQASAAYYSYVVDRQDARDTLLLLLLLLTAAADTADSGSASHRSVRPPPPLLHLSSTATHVPSKASAGNSHVALYTIYCTCTVLLYKLTSMH